MVTVNENFLKVEKSYLFTDIARKVREFQAEHSEAKLIRLGIGDVTRPLVPAVVKALEAASAEMGEASTFRGYGPEQGYDFLRETIAKREFSDRGIAIDADEIFISDGAKSDMGNFPDILGSDLDVLVADPVYPVYVDTNIMFGNRIRKLPCLPENDFLPLPPEEGADLIYICSPNNPTGAVMSREVLEAWVAYAKKHGALILFDAAYEAFITNDAPHSIYEIPGAREVAVEIRSFSKLAGFTGLRCGYTVVPFDLKVAGSGQEGGGEAALAKAQALHPLWLRRQTTKFNGVPYVVQRAAEAVYSEEGYAACLENIRYYLANAALLKKGCEEIGLEVSGGENAPYVWVKTPDGFTSWEFFDKLLNEAWLVTTPGSGFGEFGEGYVRLSAFGSREDCVEAIERLGKLAIGGATK